jgi:hypothetical protein
VSADKLSVVDFVSFREQHISHIPAGLKDATTGSIRVVLKGPRIQIEPEWQLHAHELLDKFRDNSPARLFLSDSRSAPYKDSYLSERLVCCQQVVRYFVACMLLNLKGVVGAKGFEPSTSWSRTRNKSN